MLLSHVALFIASLLIGVWQLAKRNEPQPILAITDLYAVYDGSLVESGDSDNEDWKYWDSHRSSLGVVVNLTNKGNTIKHFSFTSAYFSEVGTSAGDQINGLWIQRVGSLYRDPIARYGISSLPPSYPYDEQIPVDAYSCVLVQFRGDGLFEDYIWGKFWFTICFKTDTGELACDRETGSIELVM